MGKNIAIALVLAAAPPAVAAQQPPSGNGSAAGVAGTISAKPIFGTDAASCQPGAKGPAVLVTVIGFKDRDGRLRVQYYPDEKEDYLGSGRYLRRQEMPVTQAGDMQVCLTLPAPGSYVMVALHDRNEDGRLNVFSDGIGFSNNPRIPLGKPKLEKTRFTAGRGVTKLDVVLNYMRGLSPRPIDRD